MPIATFIAQIEPTGTRRKHSQEDGGAAGRVDVPHQREIQEAGRQSTGGQQLLGMTDGIRLVVVRE